MLPDIITSWICISTSGSCRCMLLSSLTCLLAVQIYLMLSCCPCEGHIAGIVDAPNCCCTLAIPIAIFDQVSPLCCALPITVPVSCARVLPECVHATMRLNCECMSKRPCSRSRCSESSSYAPSVIFTYVYCPVPWFVNSNNDHQ